MLGEKAGMARNAPLAFCLLLIFWPNVNEATAQPYLLHSGVVTASTFSSEFHEASVTVVPGSQGQVLIVDEDGDGQGVVLVLGDTTSSAANQRPAGTPRPPTVPTIAPPPPMAAIEVNPVTGHSFIRSGDSAPQLVDPRTGKPFDLSAPPAAQFPFASGQLQPPRVSPPPPAVDGAIGFVLPPPLPVVGLVPETNAQTEQTALPDFPSEPEDVGGAGGVEVNNNAMVAQAPESELADTLPLFPDSG